MQITGIKGGQIQTIAEDLKYKEGKITVYSNKKVEEYGEKRILFTDGSYFEKNSSHVVNLDESTYIQVLESTENGTNMSISGSKPVVFGDTLTIKSKDGRTEMNIKGCNIGVIGNNITIGTMDL